MEQSVQNSEIASHLALRVALQTMKDRCIMLQKRLNIVEDENQRLQESATNTTAAVPNSITSSGAAEIFQLRLQLADLQRHKTQLNEHINMVSNENRKLWSRLSQMAKEQGKSIHDNTDCTLTPTAIGCQRDAEDTAAGGSVGAANQNLIRSKTFTQHSPNPHLRHKMISSDIVTNNGNDGDVSLKDVTLPAYVDAAREAVVKYAEAAEVELGFGYLNVAEEQTGDSGNDTDFSAEAKKCIEGLQEMRREAMKQQQELNMALHVMENRFALHSCSECEKKSQKPEMADKSLETDESLGEIKFSGKKPKNPSDQLDTTPVDVFVPQLNIIQRKIRADESEKTCPMCGCIYSSLISFDAFRQHVETHFLDESLSDVDTSLERNFELVSHTVGDF